MIQESIQQEERLNSNIWDTLILIDNAEIKNRIVFPPISSNWADKDGSITDKMMKFYKTIAEGGCGMIVVEGAAISPEGKSITNALCIYEERHVFGLKLLADIITGNNCFASLQLAHAGGQANPNFTGYESISPSKMEKDITGTSFASREITVKEIEEIRKKFVNSALLASYAGFKAVEIHLAHGYLLHEFLSEHTNKRKDNYGGNLENRMRFPLEIIGEIKEKVPNLVLGVRISGEDYVKDGINEEANRKILPVLESAGIKYFSVTAGIYETSKFKHEAMKKEKFFDYARSIKGIVNKPVIGVGKILDLIQAENHLKKSDCDMIAIGRGLIADPFMIKKTKSGQAFNRCTECDECAYLRFGIPSLSCPVKGY